MTNEAGLSNDINQHDRLYISADGRVFVRKPEDTITVEWVRGEVKKERDLLARACYRVVKWGEDITILEYEIARSIIEGSK